MLIISRHAGEALVIGEILVYLSELSERHATIIVGDVNQHDEDHIPIGDDRMTLDLKPDLPVKLNGGKILLSFEEFRGDKIRFGVEAPSEVPVHRKEVWDAIRRYELSHPNEPEGKGDFEATAREAEEAVAEMLRLDSQPRLPAEPRKPWYSRLLRSLGF